MLEKIIENKTQINILTFFLASPERSFFIGELESRVGGKNLLADLGSLVRMEYLFEYTKKSRKYFRINRKHPEYVQLKDQSSKFVKSYEDEFYKHIKKLNGVKLVILSGIFTGQMDQECDLLLVGEFQQRALEKFIEGAQKIAGQEINFVVMPEKELDYRRNIFDRFIKNLLEMDHLVVVNKIKTPLK